MNAKLPILSMEVVLWVGVQRKFSLNEYGNFLVLCVNRAVEKLHRSFRHLFQANFAGGTINCCLVLLHSNCWEE